MASTIGAAVKGPRVQSGQIGSSIVFPDNNSALKAGTAGPEGTGCPYARAPCTDGIGICRCWRINQKTAKAAAAAAAISCGGGCANASIIKGGSTGTIHSPNIAAR